MAKLVFRLRGVPDDEAEDVRRLLDDNGIDYYETSAGNWGISMPALWVEDASQADRAKSLIDEYEEARAERVRGEYERLKREGKNRTLLDVIREDPLRFFLYLAIILFVLYLSTTPFIDFGGR